MIKNEQTRIITYGLLYLIKKVSNNFLMCGRRWGEGERIFTTLQFANNSLYSMHSVHTEFHVKVCEALTMSRKN